MAAPLLGREDEMAAAVTRPARLVLVHADRSLLAAADDLQAVAANPKTHEVVPDRVASPLAKRQVVLIGAARIGVAFDRLPVPESDGRTRATVVDGRFVLNAGSDRPDRLNQYLRVWRAANTTISAKRPGCEAVSAWPVDCGSTIIRTANSTAASEAKSPIRLTPEQTSPKPVRPARAEQTRIHNGCGTVTILSGASGLLTEPA